MKRELEPQLEMPAAKELYKTLARIEKSDEMAAFLRDLFTLEELEEASRRLLTAKLLSSGKSVREVAKEIGTSTTTVVRINYWLHHGLGGYGLALEKLRE